jgi:hypothetical protein
MDISVLDDLARTYERATDEDKRKTQWLIELVLRNLFDNKSESLGAVVQGISQRAAVRGMTPEILVSFDE